MPRPLPALLLILSLTGSAIAQPQRPGGSGGPDRDGGEADMLELRKQFAPPAYDGADPPPMPESLLRLLSATYLTDAERTDLRLRHGLWRDTDLATPEAQATAALTLGGYDHPSLTDPATPPLHRATALLERGNPQAALNLINTLQDPDAPLQAAAIAGQALIDLGRTADAIKLLAPIADLLKGPHGITDPNELTAGAHALRILSRLRPTTTADYERMTQLLSEVHQRLDRHAWPALIEEAHLLIERGNRSDGVQAAMQALSLNPRAAEAWAILGNIAVDGFNFDSADEVAQRLDAMSASIWRTTNPERSEDAQTSPLAGAIRARKHLRLNEPDLAQAALAPSLDRMPSRRPDLALWCAAEALAYDDQRTQRAFDRYEALAPGSPSAAFAIGDALSERRQYQASATWLELAHDRAPHWPDPATSLGLLEMQSGRTANAARWLRKANDMDPFNKRVQNSLRLVTDLLAYGSVETEHFIIRYATPEDGILANEMAQPLERAHTFVADLFEHEPPVKTTIELMPNSQWFGVRITGMPQIHTMAACTGPVIAMEVPRIGKQNIGEYDWLQVATHEYTHTVTLSRTQNRIPHWFTEAAAVYSEDAPRDIGRATLLSGALTNGTLFDMIEINTAFVRPKKPEDRSQAYAQSEWMYQFMVERFGKHAPLELMDAYANGEREDAAMRRILGLGNDAFREAFIEWAWADARTWGLLPDPPLDDLLIAESLDDPFLNDEATAALRDLAQSAALRASGVAADLAFKPTTLKPTPELVAALLIDNPDHPDLLRATIQREIQLAGGETTLDHAPLLERYATAVPVDPFPHRELARLYLDSDQPQRAIPHLEYLDAREVYTPAYAAELARRYSALKDYPMMADAAARALRIAPYDANLRELAAVAALRLGDLDEAERQIGALVILEPDIPRHTQRLEQLRARKANSP